jgi:hypothetical protein
VAAEVTVMSGACISLAADGVARGSLCATNGIASLLDELQYTFGEGPAVDVFRHGGVVMEPDLALPDVSRWLAFGPAAVTAGARAVFAVPLRVGAARIGALNLYRDQPGKLSDEQHADALVMANVAARAILALQAAALTGTIAAELEAEANFQLVVHQGAGMVSVQLGVSVAEALVRLRSYAFRTDRLVAEVARDVVERRLRFEDRNESGS